jgi:hypothetical protein
MRQGRKGWAEHNINALNFTQRKADLTDKPNRVFNLTEVHFPIPGDDGCAHNFFPLLKSSDQSFFVPLQYHQSAGAKRAPIESKKGLII